jgi:hypothetical protein
LVRLGFIKTVAEGDGLYPTIKGDATLSVTPTCANLWLEAQITDIGPEILLRRTNTKDFFTDFEPVACGDEYVATAEHAQQPNGHEHLTQGPPSHPEGAKELEIAQQMAEYLQSSIGPPAQPKCYESHDDPIPLHGYGNSKRPSFFTDI